MTPNTMIDNLQQLVKALEAGSYNAAPSSLVQGAALQVEDLSPVMNNVTYDNQHIKLQKMLKVEPTKGTLVQFDRQLSYGGFGGSAQLEGNVGQEETSDFVRVVVPQSYYSHVRRVTVVANMVATVDGKKAEDRAASDAALKLAGDIEFDLFRGMADFSNVGVFDGNPLATPALANIHGLDLQVRQSDSQRQAQDLMFAEYGSDQSVVISGGGTLTQDNVEDASVRSAMNMGNADRLMVDPNVLSHYNKITFGKERIILAGNAQDATGGTLRKQWVSAGTVEVEASRFLSGKTSPQRPRAGGPAAPTSAVLASVTVSGVVTSFKTTDTYIYYVTSINEVGESPRTVMSVATGIAASANGDELQITITKPAGTIRGYNVYRSAANGPITGAKFIGRVMDSGASTTIFYDLNNKIPGFVTGFLVQGDTMALAELAPYSRMKLAVTDLSMPECFYRFATLKCTQPRKNVLIDNLI